MRKRISMVVGCIWLSLCPLFAQTAGKPYNDQPLSDTAKINQINTLARQLEDSTERIDQALAYAKEALQLSKERSYDLGVFTAAHTLGNLYQKQAEYPQAQEYFDIALQVAEDTENPLQTVTVLERIGFNLYRQGDFDAANAAYFKALKIAETGNVEKLRAQLYTNLGNVYFSMQEYAQQLNYARSALEILERIGDREQLPHVYNNMANAYFYLENHEESLKYYLLSLEISQANKDDKAIAVAYNNLGLFYYLRREFDKAPDYYQQALQIKERLGDKQGMIYTLFNMGQLNLTQERFSQAHDYLWQATKIAQEIGAKDRLVTCYRALADLSAKQENYQQAFEFHKQYTSLKDSLFNTEKNEKITEMQTRFETEKKDREIELLNKSQVLQATQLERKTIIQYAFMGALVLFGIIAYILFRNFRQKRLLLRTRLVQEQKEAERLHGLDRMKTNFFDNIAHEFRTPLTLILGPAEQIGASVTDEKSQQNAGLIQRSALQLLKLINQMLDLSKLESGVELLEKSHQDMVAAVKGMTMSFESLAVQKGIALEFLSEVSTYFMDFDAHKMEKILANLLSNAFKFTPRGGRITVRISTSPSIGKKPEKLLINVRDTGTGIPSNHIASVFDRFYQGGDAGHRAMGTGIGLALTKELVELHAGSIQVESSADAGTTFLITLPIKKEYKGTVTPIKSIGKYEKAAIDFKNIPAEGQGTEIAVPATDKEDEEIILIIEDNEDVRLFIRQSLETHYSIIEAPDGEAGVAAAQQHVPDLIISDVMMPRKDGYQVCSTLKKDEKTSHIPVILLTAKAGMESKLEGLETGADDYLAKPFNTKELLVRIRNLIQLRRQLRKKFAGSDFSEALPKELPPLESAFLLKTKGVVEQFLDDDAFSIEDLSREVGMSRTQVHRKLKALTGQSASLFMRGIRLQHALKFLKTTDKTVSEVAYQTGFSSPAYFSTCFTAQYGCPPSTVKDGAGLV